MWEAGGRNASYLKADGSISGKKYLSAGEVMSTENINHGVSKKQANSLT